MCFSAEAPEKMRKSCDGSNSAQKVVLPVHSEERGEKKSKAQKFHRLKEESQGFLEVLVQLQRRRDASELLLAAVRAIGPASKLFFYFVMGWPFPPPLDPWTFGQASFILLDALVHKHLAA
ncbi:hypothetical protein Mapa_011377 [Marchantia paleacea]|nr:hypothetical protein Mapa_011377 [Marchantia paleacea]